MQVLIRLGFAKKEQEKLTAPDLKKFAVSNLDHLYGNQPGQLLRTLQVKPMQETISAFLDEYKKNNDEGIRWNTSTIRRENKKPIPSSSAIHFKQFQPPASVLSPKNHISAIPLPEFNLTTLRGAQEPDSNDEPDEEENEDDQDDDWEALLSIVMLCVYWIYAQFVAYKKLSLNLT